MMAKIRLALLGVGLVLLAAAGYWFVVARATNRSDRVRVSGNIEVTDAEVSFKIPGRVEARLVDEGHIVEKGQVVARLETSDLEQEVAMRKAELTQAQVALNEAVASRPDELAAAEAAVRKARWSLDLLEEGSREEEIEVAKHAQRKAEAEKERLESEYLRAKRLIEARQRVISQEGFDRVEAAYEVAVERLNEAEWQLRMLQRGTRAQQIESARAALEEAKANYELVKKQEKIERAEARKLQAEAALRLAETRFGYATLSAPLSGVVLSENVEPGEYVAPGTPVVTVGDLENVWLRAYINETDLGRVKLGQEALITADTYPDNVYRGRVSFIASEAEFTPKNVQTQEERVKLVYRIKIDAANPRMELKPGMPADAEIVVGAPSAGSE